MKNYKEYDVVIVGAGAGGLAAAAYLARYGHRVLICEKNEKTGGLVNSFQYQGFHFDGGIRAFENSGIVMPMLKQLGISMDFVQNSVCIRVGNDRIIMNSKKNLYDYQELLCRQFPEDREDIYSIIKEIDKVMDSMEVLYEIDNPLFIDNIGKDRNYLLHTLLPWFIKYQKNIKKIEKLSEPIKKYLEKFTTNRSLIDIITQHFFENTPAYFALSYFGQYADYIYPVGGTGMFVEKLYNFFKESGGEIRPGMHITHVDAQKKELIAKDGSTYGYKKLIWACDSTSLCNSLNKDIFIRNKKAYDWKIAIRNNKGGDSIFSVFLGIDMDCNKFAEICGEHCFYTPENLGLQATEQMDLRNQTDVERIKTYLRYTTYEISCPVLRDSSLAPEGKMGIIISTLMDYTLFYKMKECKEYDAFKKICEDTIIEIIADNLIFDLRDKLLFVISATPLTISEIVGTANGAITGWAFSDHAMPSVYRLTQISKSIFTPFKHIYQVGQWAFSPSGLPTCLLTGKLAADEIHKKLKGKK